MEEDIIDVNMDLFSLLVLLGDELAVDGVVDLIVIGLEPVLFIAVSLLVELEVLTVHQLEHMFPRN